MQGIAPSKPLFRLTTYLLIFSLLSLATVMEGHLTSAAMATTPRPQDLQPVSENISDTATNQGMNIAESTISSNDAVTEPHVAPDAALPPITPSASNVQATAMADPSSPATGHLKKRSSLAELCGDPTLANALAFVAVVIAVAYGGLQVKYLIWTGGNDAFQSCQNARVGMLLFTHLPHLTLKGCRN